MRLLALILLFIALPFPLCLFFDAAIRKLTGPPRGGLHRAALVVASLVVAIGTTVFLVTALVELTIHPTEWP